MAEKFRRTPYHQAADEHCDDDKGEIVHPTYAYPAKPRVNLHIQHFNHTGNRHGRIMHAIYRSVGSHRGSHTPQTGGSGSQTYFLALHGSVILCNTHGIHARISFHLCRHVNTYPDEECGQHDTINTVSQSPALHIEAKGKYHGHRQNQDRATFHHIRKICRVFQRMRRVHPIISASVRTQLLNRNDSGSRPLRHMLCNPFERRYLHLSVESHRSALRYQYKAHYQ